MSLPPAQLAAQLRAQPAEAARAISDETAALDIRVTDLEDAPPGGGAVVYQLSRPTVADETALDTRQVALGLVPVSGTVTKASIIAEGSGVPANATDFAQFTFYSFEANADLNEILAIATSEAGLGAYAVTDVTLSEAPGVLAVTAGQSIVCEIEKGGDGRQLPPLLLVVEITPS